MLFFYCPHGIRPVGVEDAVQVVAFVLENDGGITLHPLGDGLSGGGEIGNLHGAVPGDNTAEAGEGQAAFGPASRRADKYY